MIAVCRRIFCRESRLAGSRGDEENEGRTQGEEREGGLSRTTDDGRGQITAAGPSELWALSAEKTAYARGPICVIAMALT